MRYRVVATAQFDALWQSAIALGVLYPAVDEIRRQELSDFLMIDPRHSALQFDGGPANLGRAVLIDGPTRVEVWYEVVEDDLTVYLVSLEVFE